MMDISLDLIHTTTVMPARGSRHFAEFSTCPTDRNPLLGKGLLRLPPFHAEFLLISSGDLWTHTTTRCHGCGVTFLIPQAPLSWLWTVCCVMPRRRFDLITEPLWADLSHPPSVGSARHRCCRTTVHPSLSGGEQLNPTA